LQAQVDRVPGGYIVTRFFRAHAAAQRAVDLLLSVNEDAFDPGPQAYDAHPGSLNLPSNEDGS